MVGGWGSQRVLHGTGGRITAVNRHAGGIRAARGKDIQHRHDEFAKRAVEAGIFQADTHNTAHSALPDHATSARNSRLLVRLTRSRNFKQTQSSWPPSRRPTSTTADPPG